MDDSTALRMQRLSEMHERISRMDGPAVMAAMATYDRDYAAYWREQQQRMQETYNTAIERLELLATKLARGDE